MKVAMIQTWRGHVSGVYRELAHGAWYDLDPADAKKLIDIGYALAIPDTCEPPKKATKKLGGYENKCNR